LSPRLAAAAAASNAPARKAGAGADREMLLSALKLAIPR
jgi:hypothetical protein